MSTVLIQSFGEPSGDDGYIDELDGFMAFGKTTNEAHAALQQAIESKVSRRSQLVITKDF